MLIYKTVNYMNKTSISHLVIVNILLSFFLCMSLSLKNLYATSQTD